MSPAGPSPQAPAAVVTGAASGIGAAVAAELRGRGWAVTGLDRAQCPGVDLAVRLDVTDAAAVAAAVAAAEQRFGPVGAAVSAAGHYELTAVSDVTWEQWQRMLRVHLGGAFHLLRAVLPGMLARSGGAFVAIASELAVGGGGPGDAAYAAAKGAVLGLVRSAAAEAAPAGVRVNAVAPGPTDTPLLAADSPWRAPEYLATLPAGRLATPQEVAACVAFLVAEGTFCVGETLHPNSGAVI